MEQTLARVLQAYPTRLHWLEPALGLEALRAHVDWIEAGLTVADVGITFEALCERVAGGEYRVVLAMVAGEPAAVVVLEIVYNGNPTKKTLSVIVAGGEKLGLWLHPMNRALREIAKAHACERVIIGGRPGWERALRRLGWEKVGVILEAKPK